MGCPSPSARDVLWHVTFWGFAVNYMVRVNLNIAIVAMVKNRPSLNGPSGGYCDTASLPAGALDDFNTTAPTSGTTPTSVILSRDVLLGATLLTEESLGNKSVEDFNVTSDDITTQTVDYAWSTETLGTDSNFSIPDALFLKAEQDSGPRYDWDEYQQGLVLGGYFWLHWVTQIPGGMLAQRYGTKLVLGASNVISCVMAVLFPIAASIDCRVLIALRVVQGFIAGLVWPSMHNLTASWIPPNDRSKFITAYLGSSVGAALTFPLGGFLIEWFGWPSVFYTTALLGAVWFLAWWFLVFDHPADHPRISKKELEYIQSSLGHDVAKRKPPTPWMAMLKSGPLWMNILAQWGNVWGLLTLLTQTPTYFRHVHGWSIQATGLLSGFPHLCRTSFALVLSFSGDYLLKRNIISRNFLRKAATFISNVAHGVFVLGLAYCGCSPVAAVVFLALAVASSGAVSTGPLAALVDISPNFSSISLGACGMVAVLPGFISPVIVGLLTFQNQTPSQWRVVFLITAAMLVVPGLMYTAWASADVQPWNAPPADPEEMAPLPAKDVPKDDLKDGLKDDSKDDAKDNDVKASGGA